MTYISRFTFLKKSIINGLLRVLACCCVNNCHKKKASCMMRAIIEQCSRIAKKGVQKYPVISLWWSYLFLLLSPFLKYCTLLASEEHFFCRWKLSTVEDDGWPYRYIYNSSSPRSSSRSTKFQRSKRALLASNSLTIDIRWQNLLPRSTDFRVLWRILNSFTFTLWSILTISWEEDGC